MVAKWREARCLRSTLLQHPDHRLNLRPPARTELIGSLHEGIAGAGDPASGPRLSRTSEVPQAIAPLAIAHEGPRELVQPDTPVLSVYLAGSTDSASPCYLSTAEHSGTPAASAASSASTWTALPSSKSLMRDPGQVEGFLDREPPADLRGAGNIVGRERCSCLVDELAPGVSSEYTLTMPLLVGVDLRRRGDLHGRLAGPRPLRWPRVGGRVGGAPSPPGLVVDDPATTSAARSG
jgi:hypothetical protein